MFQSPHSTPPSRLLHFNVEGKKKRLITILDSDKTTPIYIINSHALSLSGPKPHMHFCHPSTPSSALETHIGSASFHSLSRTIDLEFGSSSVSFKPKGSFTRSFQFQSTVGPCTWEYESILGSNIRLVNAEGNWLARLESKPHSESKGGQMEIAGIVQWGPGLLDEIVISGMAMMEADRRVHYYSTAGGDVAGAGAAAAGAAAGAAG